MKRLEILKKIESGEISAAEGTQLLQGLASLTKSASPEHGTQTGYFHKAWHPSPLSAATAHPPVANLLVFDQGDDLCQALQALADKDVHASSNVILVQPGQAFAANGAHRFTLRPDRAEDYQRLFQALEADGIPEHIVFNWADAQPLLSQTTLSTACERGVHALFAFFSALKSLAKRIPVQVVYSYPLSPTGTPPFEALGALAKTICLENPHWGCAIIGFDPASEKIQPTALLSEFRQGLSACDIHFRNGQRFTSKWETQETPVAATPDLSIAADGVYLITGGMGGLGRIFAEHFCKGQRVRLVLCGRSPLDPAKKAHLDGLQATGADVRYLQADLSQAQEVESLISRIKQEVGPLNGIVHAAGVIRDALLQNKTRADLDRVLAPKLWGGFFLDQATKDQPLNFFVSFGSLAGVFGNAGQMDYACANHFLDCFADYRNALVKAGTRSGKTITIHWPLWRHGGMRPDDEALGRVKGRLGLDLLENQQGLRAFHTCFSLEYSQILVLHGQPKAMEDLLRLSASKIKSSPSANKALSPKDRQAFLGPTEQFLKSILSKVSKVPESRIQANEPLENVGIDSLMIMTLNKELETIFGDLPKTLFFEYQNLAELSEYFLANHRDSLMKHLSPAAKAPSPVQPKSTVKTSKTKGSRFVSARIAPPQPRPTRIEDVAIIGVAGRYPGANDLETFWENLKAGIDSITEIPADRWDLDHYYDQNPKKLGKHYSKWGGFIEDIDKFDPLFFNISPQEAELIDPQERLFLQNVWHTLEDAAYTRSQLSQKKIGVFVGIMYGYYHLVGAENSQNANSLVSGTSYASMANRVSYFFNFTGPSIALDSMCSSSLTAIHLACQSILQGECEMAIAGGVNATIHPHKYQLLSQGRFASTDGRCRSFGAGGDGYVPGEGIGSVLLKPLDRAIADGDRIHAVIKSSAVNHGGKTNGYSVPNPKAQEQLIVDALRRGGMTPADLSYLEAHGTGTSLGDPIEIAGLTRAFRAFPAENLIPDVLPIGSVKSNIGHLESAAGIAAVTKVLLQLRHRQLVPSLHAEELNPNIQFKDTPFQVQRSLAPWSQPMRNRLGQLKPMPRRAGVSSFGAGGANAHLILEEYPEPDRPAMASGNQPHLVVLSARTDEALKASALQLRQFIAKSHEAEGTDGERQVIPDHAEALRTITAEVAEVAIDQITFDEEWSQFGFDPLLLAQLGERLEDRFGLDFSPKIFTDHPTLTALLRYLLKHQTPGPADASDASASIPKRRTVRLEDLAYTLQVGREPLRQRLAVIASDLDELETKLEHLLAHWQESQTEMGFRGSVQADGPAKDSLITGRAGQEFLNILVEDREWEKLAELWVSGVDLPWPEFYQVPRSNPPRRIGLPHYPFARERYWVATGTTHPSRSHQLHPMIDANISIMGEGRFTSRVHLDNELLTGDFSQAKKRFPALGFLELARAAGTLSREKQVMRIEKIVWGSAPILMDEPLDLQIRLFRNGHPDRLEFEIQSSGEAYDPTIHAQGSLSFQKEKNLSAGAPLTKAELHERCPEKRAPAEIYQTLRKMGFHDLPHQQVLRVLHFGPETAWAEVACTAETPKGMEAMPYHPFVLDTAFKVSYWWMVATERGAPSCGWPTSIERFTMVAPFTETLAIQILHKGSQHQATVEEHTLDILFTDPDHALVASIEGMKILVKAHATLGMTTTRPVPLREKVEREIKSLVSRLIKIEPEKISVTTSLTEYGFESTTVVDFAEALNELYDLDITPAVFYEKDTIRGFSEYLVSEYESAIAALYGPSASPVDAGTSSPRSLPPLVQKESALLSGQGVVSSRNREPIAIVGMAGRFPLSPDLDRFWENLKDEKDMISEVPADRWDWKKFHPDHGTSTHQTAVKWGGFIEDADKFDARFFKISPMEAEMMDPQHRIFLETVWTTIEDAGYKASSFSGRRIGLFAGVQFNDYGQMLANQGLLNPQMGIGNEHSILVNRISYLLNLKGPSEPYNTACSSSLVAINRAVSSIRSGESEMAIAGGVTLMISPYTTISGDSGGVLSPVGRCKTLDESADGYVRGEGVGALLLKPLAKAIEDGDHIYAVIKGTAANHGGKAPSLTAPNSEAQAALLTAAYREAEVDPENISYIELHGTGTKLGDPVEIEGIKASFRDLARQRGKTGLPEGYCGLGSVKTNIGHLEPASGLAGLMKLILSLRHKTLPGILHLNNLNPFVKLKGTPFYVVEHTKAWQPSHDQAGKPLPRVAGVSSFGFGGTNAHIVLEEFEDAGREDANAEPSPQIIVLSAKNEDRLKAYAQQFESFLKQQLGSDAPIAVRDLAFTLANGREEMTERLAVVGFDLADILDKLARFNQADTDATGLFRGKASADKDDREDRDPVILAGVKTAGDLAIVAQHWVEGGAVDWAPDSTQPKPKRIPLPTYPFEKKRYWVPNEPEPALTASTAIQSQASGPGLTKVTGKNLDDMVVSELKMIFAEELKTPVEDLEMDTNFDDYGVDSIIGAVITQKIQDRFGDFFSLSLLIEYPTLNELKAHVMEEADLEGFSPQAGGGTSLSKRKSASRLPPELVALNRKGTQQPSYWVHGGPGYAALYHNLSEFLGPDYPFYAFQAKGLDNKSIPHSFEEMVEHYIHCIKCNQAEGPYIIGGYSYGGLVAYEIAQRLHQRGDGVTRLYIFDTLPTTEEGLEIFTDHYGQDDNFLTVMMANEFAGSKKVGKSLITVEELMTVHDRVRVDYAAKLAKERGNSPMSADELYNYIRGCIKLCDVCGVTYDTYRQQPYHGSPVSYFKAVSFLGGDNWLGTQEHDFFKDHDYVGTWRSRCKNGFTQVDLPSDHFNMLESPALEIAAEHVAKTINPSLTHWEPPKKRMRQTYRNAGPTKAPAVEKT